MYDERFPLTYTACRGRFRQAADRAGVPTTAHAISARGPADEQLTIDVAALGRPAAPRVLVVLAGVHGVEGFAGSAVMCEALSRWTALPADDVGVILVHGVNPWGMAWWRRQNESNVDLNRNWDRDDRIPEPNPGYAVMHPLLCPAGSSPPTASSMLDRSAELVREHGHAWVRRAIADGQYSHPDGLYFGGDRTEESTAVVTRVVAERVTGATDVLTVDLHTGHGHYGAVTLLTQTGAGSENDRWIRDRFPAIRVESAGGTSPKQGLLAPGLAAVAGAATSRSATMEIGTYDDTTMILAARAEHWVHRHGDRTDPEHAAIVRHHLDRSTPDDPGWEAAALHHGEVVLDTALAAVCG